MARSILRSIHPTILTMGGTLRRRSRSATKSPASAGRTGEWREFYLALILDANTLNIASNYP